MYNVNDLIKKGLLAQFPKNSMIFFSLKSTFLLQKHFFKRLPNSKSKSPQKQKLKKKKNFFKWKRLGSKQTFQWSTKVFSSS